MYVCTWRRTEPAATGMSDGVAWAALAGRGMRESGITTTGRGIITTERGISV